MWFYYVVYWYFILNKHFTFTIQYVAYLLDQLIVSINYSIIMKEVLSYRASRIIFLNYFIKKKLIVWVLEVPIY